MFLSREAGDDMRAYDYFILAVCGGTVFGMAEGAVQCVTRYFPVLRASFKVSPHAFWITPTLDVAVFLLLALVFLSIQVLICGPLNRLFTTRRKSAFVHALPRAVCAVFVFTGCFLVVMTPGLIHPAAGAVMCAGLAAVCFRSLDKHEHRLLDYLRRGVVCCPVAIAAAAALAYGYERSSEQWRVANLPDIAQDATNVLVIVLDTVRSDSFMRPESSSLTPHIDRVASSGTYFDNAWSTTSWSLPSQASILTGRYPHEHGADWPAFRLDEQTPTLAEFFAGRGYVTGAFSSNAAWITPEYLGRGFHRFEAYTTENLLRRGVLGRIADRFLNRVGYHFAGRGKRARTLNAEFCQFLDDYSGRPFFAYLCYMDVNRTFHDEWFNSRPGALATLSEVYDAYERGLRELDARIGELWTELQRRGVLENTMIIITSDHGESFGADVLRDHDPRGHGTSLYSEQTKVPLFVVCPSDSADRRCDTRVASIRQIPATIARLLDLTDAPFLGDALIETRRPDAESSALMTLRYDDQYLDSVLSGSWQYIRDASKSLDAQQLFDLASDPCATENVTGAQSILESLRSLLDELLDRHTRTPFVQGG